MTPSNADRARAYRIRALIRKGGKPPEDDVAFLAEYEAAQAKPPDLGASLASRRVSFDIEEHQAAVGTGAAAEAAAAGNLAREEGRRLDYLTHAGIDALVKAAGLSHEMARTLLDRTKALEEVHLSMLDAVREQYLARTQAEVDAMQAGTPETQEAGGGFDAMLAEVAKPFIQGAMMQAAMGAQKKNA